MSWQSNRSLDGDTGTQVNKSSRATTSATVVIHTVTSGKTFYLSAAFLIGQDAKLVVRNAATPPVIQYELLHTFWSASGYGLTLSYPNPRKLPAGYDIAIVEGGYGNADAGIFGWEE